MRPVLIADWSNHAAGLLVRLGLLDEGHRLGF